VLGIKTRETAQLIYVDTPGIHDYSGRAMNRHMNRTASSALLDVDVVVFLVDGLKWMPDDDLVLKKLGSVECPVILAVNKIDLLANRDELLPRLQVLSGKYSFEQVIPISATKGDNVTALERAVETLLPQAAAMFPEDQVEIESFKSEPGITHIHALIWVERKSQKTIVIGKQGRLLKEVGIEARRDIETLIDGKVNLKLWVKIKEGWADDERALRSLGYNHDE
jgi:GTP-binding protein Era